MEQGLLLDRCSQSALIVHIKKPQIRQIPHPTIALSWFISLSIRVSIVPKHSANPVLPYKPPIVPTMSSLRESSDNRPWQGNGRGRGHGGFGGTRGFSQGLDGRPARGSFWKSTSAQPSSPEPALGSPLSTISQADLTKTAGKYESDSLITDCVTVTSYNWLDRAKPTIVVPGKPHVSFSP